jgi:acetyl-CoA carboxylase biotin carboxyl carrier protein
VTDLPEVRDCLIQILQALPGLPRRLHLSSGDVTVELEWPATTPPTETVAPGRTTVPALPADVTSVGCAAVNAAVMSKVNVVDGVAVRSPSVGTFYRSPEPGAPPFVAEGDLVQAGQQIAIVEAMKLMLPVEAEHSGRVARVLKSDGEPVEYGEPLIELASGG